jgi:hypothetical protein
VINKINIKLMDWDETTDETAGSISFDMKAILDGHLNGKFVWKNVYGSPLNQSNS